MIKKWQKREGSKNSWIIRIDEIIKRTYELSAKNPNRVLHEVYESPGKLVCSVFKKKREIVNVLEKVRKLIGA